MKDEGSSGALSSLVSRFGQRRGGAETAVGGHEPPLDQVFPTRALSSFLSLLSTTEAPVVLDLGPVVGANVTFLGERLGCKLLVEDVFGDLDRLKRADGTDDSTRAFLGTRLSQSDDTVDGILCWDLFDYLERDAAATVAGELVRVLRPGGALFVCFGSEPRNGTGHTKYEIVDETSLRYRFCAGAGRKVRVLQSREITQLFGDLTVADSFLLTSRMREMLFRKHPDSTSAV